MIQFLNQLCGTEDKMLSSAVKKVALKLQFMPDRLLGNAGTTSELLVTGHLSSDFLCP